MIDNTTLQKLFTKKTKTRKPKMRVLLTTPTGGVDSAEWIPIYKMGDVDLGIFEGRAGTIRRSRKGATRRQANGRRNYVASESVLAYKLVK